MGSMGKGRLALGVVLVTLVAIAIGYVIASAVLTFRDLGFQAEIDFFYIAQNYRAIGAVRPDDFRLINLIMGAAGMGGLMMSLAMSAQWFLRKARHGLCDRQAGQTKITLAVSLLQDLSPRADRRPDRAR